MYVKKEEEMNGERLKERVAVEYSDAGEYLRMNEWGVNVKLWGYPLNTHDDYIHICICNTHMECAKAEHLYEAILWIYRPPPPPTNKQLVT